MIFDPSVPDSTSEEALTEIDTFIGERSARRYFALFIDNIIAFTLAFILAFSPADLLYGSVKFLLLLIFYILYFIITEAIWSRTFGKMLCGLIVVNKNLDKISWKESVVRNSIRLFDANIIVEYFFFIMCLVVVISKRRQRIGDMLAGTVVIGYYKYLNHLNDSSAYLEIQS